MIAHLKARLLRELVGHFGEDARRIDHALQVLAHAEALLAETPEADTEIVLGAAVTHDFGITEAERKHNSSGGKWQEKYGPRLARPALQNAGLSDTKIKTVSAIIRRHHSPPKRPSIEFRLLYEADCLVNVEDFPKITADREKMRRFVRKNFETEAGIRRAHEVLLDEDPIFTRMGGVYKLLVDEESRRDRESDLILEIAKQSQGRKAAGNTRVLDLACGNGFHARLLAEQGYEVLGLDYSEPLLEEARRQGGPKNLRYIQGNLLEALDLRWPAHLTLVLGNTLSVFTSQKDLARVLENAARSTHPAGLVLCQILNYKKLEDEKGRALVRTGEAMGKETVVTKSLAPQGKEVVITLAAAQKNEGQWESFGKASTLRAWSARSIDNAARKAGLTRVERYGDLRGSKWDAESSSDYVALYQRQAP